MQAKQGRFRWPAILSALVTVCGVVSSPEILALLGTKAAAVVAVVGVVLQALTKPVARKDYERVT